MEVEKSLRYAIDLYNDYILNGLGKTIKQFNVNWTGANGEEVRIYLDGVNVEKHPLLNGKAASVYEYMNVSNRTYDVAVYCTIHVGDTYEIKNHLLFRLPVMTGSMLCCNGLDKHDYGGYFVINGMSKVIVPQFNMAMNRIVHCDEDQIEMYCQTPLAAIPVRTILHKNPTNGLITWLHKTKLNKGILIQDILMILRPSIDYEEVLHPIVYNYMCAGLMFASNNPSEACLKVKHVLLNNR
jgi:DNA-directed RNA polymerase beta subunit